MISNALKIAVLVGDSSKEASAGRLKLVRLSLGMTQVAIAEMMGTAPNNYQAMEKGTTYPRPTFIQNLYEMTRVDHNFIYSGDVSRLPADVLAGLEAEALRRATY